MLPKGYRLTVAVLPDPLIACNAVFGGLSALSDLSDLSLLSDLSAFSDWFSTVLSRRLFVESVELLILLLVRRFVLSSARTTSLPWRRRQAATPFWSGYRRAPPPR